MSTIWKKRIVDVYILKEVSYPFLIGIIIISIIMLSNFLFQLTDLIIVKNVPIKLVMELLAYKMPEVIVNTFPMAILFATITGMGRLSQENEFTALRMGGISLFRLILPLVILGIIISGMTFYLNESVVPWSNHQARNIIRRTVLRDAMPEVQENVFFQGPQGRVFYVENYNEDSGEMESIVIYDKSQNKELKFPAVMTATKGIIEENNWILKEGIIHEYDDQGRLAIESRFQETELQIADDATELFGRQRTTSEMSRRELRREIQIFQESGIDVTSLLVDYHLKLARPLAALLFILIGTPLSLAQKDSKIASILMTIGIIFLYYLVLSVSRSLGRNGYLNPLLVAWLPNIVFTFIGIVLIVWRESLSNILKRFLPGLFLAGLCLFLTLPAAAADRVNIRGESLDYNKETGLVEISKNVDGQYRQYYFHADKIIVKMGEGEEVFSNPEEIEMSPGDFSGCDNEKPHYLFRARTIRVYPGDYLEAYHVTFREFNGRVPLFYWPYLYISLDEEKPRITPEVGYDGRRGWFLKTTWHYRQDRFPGEYYLDLYTESGSAGGLKQYFLSDQKQRAYLYYYEQNDNGIPGLFNKEGELAYELETDNWQLDTGLSYTDYDDREIIEALVSAEHEGDNQQFDLDTNRELLTSKKNSSRDRHKADTSLVYSQQFAGDLNINFDFDRESTDYLESESRDRDNIDLNLALDKRFPFGLQIDAGVSRELEMTPDLGRSAEDEVEVSAGYRWGNNWQAELDYNYGQLDEPEAPLRTRWGTKSALSRTFGEYELEMVVERDDPSFTEEDEVRFFRLPEFNFYYQPRSDFDYRLQAGRYFEDQSGIEGYREAAEVSYNNNWRLPLNSRLNTTQIIRGYIYQPQSGADKRDHDQSQLFYSGETGLVNTFGNFRFENSFLYEDFRGISPFYFDQEEKEQIWESELRYRDDKLDISLEGGYNLQLEEYLLLAGIITYRPTPEWRLSLKTEYDLNQELFEDDIEISSRYQGDKLEANTDLTYDMNSGQTKKLENRITYEIKGDRGWYLENNISYDYTNSAGERLEKANLALKKSLHCRELALSYDYIKEEIMLTYTIDLFPDQGITLGQSEERDFILNVGETSISDPEGSQ